MVIQAIGSVLEQHGKKHEIILVDDASTDRTADVVAQRFPQVKLITTTGLGPGRARNAGVLSASGDVLMFLDSDDIWLPHHMQALCTILDKGFPLAYGVTRTIDEINDGEFVIPSYQECHEGDCFEKLLRWCFLVPSAVAVKRDSFDAVQGFGAEPFGEDWLFFLKLAALFPFGFAAVPPITLRRLHKGSLCAMADPTRILALITDLIQFLENEPRAIFADIAHFLRLEQFVKTRGTAWKSAQDWYVAMLEEGIL
jgi:glycosyltransferase involved in cell wall biosynthesis